MLFRAQNLGPIRDAELDLSKRLIILAGPNNSGKTYLGWALYGLRQFHKPLPCVRKLVDAAMASPTGSCDAGPVQEFIAVFAAELCAAYAKHIHRDFAAAANSFASTVLTLTPDEMSSFQTAGSLLGKDLIFRVELDADTEKTNVQISVKRHVMRGGGRSEETELEVVSLSSLGPEVLEPDALWAIRHLSYHVIRKLFRGDFTIFPVERIATAIFSRELLMRRFEMLDEDSGDDSGDPLLAKAAIGRYPLPIRHSLRDAADLSAHGNFEHEFSDLADELEGSVLCGRFTVGEYGDVLFFPSASPQRPLGLHQSASVVKSLSALVFYLRHEARHGDHIIIDEPELNLHPDNQRRVARVLAKAVNRGIKVMMSTHSDYLIGEFNNLLMLGRDTPQAAAVRQELGYDEASILKPEQVGVYLVSDGMCKPVEVKETGFEIKTFEDAFHSMNRDAQTIYSRIFAESE